MRLKEHLAILSKYEPKQAKEMEQLISDAESSCFQIKERYDYIFNEIYTSTNYQEPEVAEFWANAYFIEAASSSSNYQIRIKDRLTIIDSIYPAISDKLKKQHLHTMKCDDVTVNNNNSFSSAGSLYFELSFFETTIPFNFDKINGFFRLNGENITTLKGCPTNIDGDYILSSGDNDDGRSSKYSDVTRTLTSIDYTPNYVGGNMVIDIFPNLKSMKLPKHVGGGIIFFYGTNYPELITVPINDFTFVDRHGNEIENLNNQITSVRRKQIIKEILS